MTSLQSHQYENTQSRLWHSFRDNDTNTNTTSTVRRKRIQRQRNGSQRNKCSQHRAGNPFQIHHYHQRRHPLVSLLLIAAICISTLSHSTLLAEATTYTTNSDMSRYYNDWILTNYSQDGDEDELSTDMEPTTTRINLNSFVVRLAPTPQSLTEQEAMSIMELMEDVMESYMSNVEFEEGVGEFEFVKVFGLEKVVFHEGAEPSRRALLRQRRSLAAGMESESKAGIEIDGQEVEMDMEVEGQEVTDVQQQRRQGENSFTTIQVRGVTVSFRNKGPPKGVVMSLLHEALQGPVTDGDDDPYNTGLMDALSLSRDVNGDGTIHDFTYITDANFVWVTSSPTSSPITMEPTASPSSPVFENVIGLGEKREQNVDGIRTVENGIKGGSNRTNTTIIAAASTVGILIFITPFVLFFMKRSSKSNETSERNANGRKKLDLHARDSLGNMNRSTSDAVSSQNSSNQPHPFLSLWPIKPYTQTTPERIRNNDPNKDPNSNTPETFLTMDSLRYSSSSCSDSLEGEVFEVQILQESAPAARTAEDDVSSMGMDSNPRASPPNMRFGNYNDDFERDWVQQKNRTGGANTAANCLWRERQQVQNRVNHEQMENLTSSHLQGFGTYDGGGGGDPRRPSSPHVGTSFEGEGDIPSPPKTRPSRASSVSSGSHNFEPDAAWDPNDNDAGSEWNRSAGEVGSAPGCGSPIVTVERIRSGFETTRRVENTSDGGGYADGLYRYDDDSSYRGDGKSLPSIS